MIFKISWESGQPNLGQKIALISSLQEIEKFIIIIIIIIIINEND